MANYEEAKVKLTNTPQNKLRSAPKSKHVTFSKEGFIWNKKILPTCLTQEITGKK